jgi:hypothetical protein
MVAGQVRVMQRAIRPGQGLLEDRRAGVLLAPRNALELAVRLITGKAAGGAFRTLRQDADGEAA